MRAMACIFCGMQEVNELRQVRNIVALSGGQRMIEGDINDAVAIFDVEYHRIAANLAPVADDALCRDRCRP